MSYKQLILLVIGLHSVAADSGENATKQPHFNQSEADTWINSTLYSSSTKDCIKVETYNKHLSSKPESSSTVAILRRVHRPSEVVSYFICTGSLIHNQVVLTAAHCFQNKSTDNLVVFAGGTLNRTLHPDEQSQSRQIESIVIHENYTSNLSGNDIALVFLKKPFSNDKLIGSICLGPKWPPQDLKCILTSWNFDDRSVNGLPKYTTSNRIVVQNEKCQRVLHVTSLGKEFELAKDNICTGGGIDKTEVWGNGGAPLICQMCGGKRRFVQIGLLSFGFEANPLPDVLTNVVFHRNWIRSSSLSKRFKIHTCINKKKENKQIFSKDS